MKNICCSWILEIIGTIEWRWGWNGTKWILRAFLKEAGCNLITFHIEMWARIEIQSVNDVKQHFKGSKYERDIWICLTHLGLWDRIIEAVWQIRKFLYVCKHLTTFTWDLAQTHLSTACAPPGKSPAWTRAGRPRRRTRRSATGGRPGGGRWLLATASQSKPHPLLPHRGSWQPILWE